MLVTNGGKHAVYNTFQTLLDPGDEVLLPAPYWTTYPEAIALAGGQAIVLPTTAAAGFRVTVDQLEAARTPNTKALLFVSPSNPTGAVYPPEEVEAIGRWAVEHGIWVVTDEIYEHLTFGDHEFTSMPALVPELAETLRRAQRRGEDLRDDRLARRLDDRPERRDHARPRTCSRTPRRTSPTSRSAPRSRRSPATSRRSRRCATRSTRRGQTMHALLSGIPGVECLEPQGAFYCFPSFEGVLGRELGGRTVTTTLELAEVLLERGEGRDRARRGVRRARLRPAVVRARRRRPRRRRRPHRRVPQLTRPQGRA